ncbi:MAG: insulinase family protein [Candidatus Limnocylindria bacterium]
MASPSSPPLPVVRTTEVDGVPLLWAERPGDPMFALQFRVGRASERPADGGITHLVEHLAMGTLGDPRYEHNAFVDAVRTVFFASGTWPELHGFTATITEALARLPLDRLDHERQVLEREAGTRVRGIADIHAQFRFGLAGFGLPAAPEFGLTRVTDTDVESWATERFQRADAVAFLTAPPPADLRLPLRDGIRHAIAEVAPVPDIPFPSHVMDGGGGVAIGAMMRRQPGATNTVAILHRRLRQRLRHASGFMYDVLADYTPLDATWAMVLIGGDCDDRHVQEVTDILFAELDRLVAGEVEQADIDAETDDLRRSALDPTAIGSILDSLAFDTLVGMRLRQPAEMLAEQEATTPADLVARATEARRSVLLMSDARDHPADVVPYPMSSPGPVAGREIKPILSAFGLGLKHRLIIGPDGLTLRNKDGLFATVRYDECVVLEDPGTEGLVLWGRDSTRVWFPLGFWRDTDRIAAEIRAAIPEDRVVRGTFSRDYFDG